jgi:hypothetical protein
MHKFQFNRANELSSKFDKLIAERRSESLSNVNPRSSKDLSSSVKPAIKITTRGNLQVLNVDDVNTINAYFAVMASDPNYHSPVIEQLVS